MLTICDGDILNETATIVVPVNTVGVAGAGLAKQTKDRFPRFEKAYRDALSDGLLDVCKPVAVEDGQFILFATKMHWKNPSSLVWISQGLEFLAAHIGEAPPSKQSVKYGDFSTITRIAIPKLGCGLGGLNWRDVLTLIHMHFDNSKFDIRIYGEELYMEELFRPIPENELPELPKSTEDLVKK